MNTLSLAIVASSDTRALARIAQNKRIGAFLFARALLGTLPVPSPSKDGWFALTGAGGKVGATAHLIRAGRPACGAKGEPSKVTAGSRCKTCLKKSN
jgi:hypothetical protein